VLVLVAVLLPPADQGTTQFDWHVAAAALQVIMQLVTVNVCASRILAAFAVPAKSPLTTLKDNTAHRIANRRMTASPLPLAPS
jgi:di/tricarboxylate transporter